MITNFSQICNNILQELQSVKEQHMSSRDRDISYVKERLKQSYDAYQADLDKSLSFLKRRDELRLMRRMNKLL